MVVSSPPAIHPPDQYQRAVIDSRERSIRVLAPAGSGKTETLGRRVGALIESGVPPRRILILTFDNQAKTSFQRTLQRLGVSGPVEIRTLNAFGLHTLVNLFPEARSRTDRSFYGPAHPLLQAFMEQTDQASLIDLFGTLKSHLFDPRDLKGSKLETWILRNYRQLVPEKFLTAYKEEPTAKTFARELRREFRDYEQFLAHRNIIDFEDQKLRALTLLEGSPDIAERVRARYDEVIVDEFQDINPLDQKLIELIARDASLVITGDDDQAIYGFRWASADYLIRPKAAFKREFTSYELRTNYRCPRTVLERSKQLIEHNGDRVRKHPKSGVEAEGSIELIKTPDRLDESRRIVQFINESMASDPALTYADFAVLTRRNQQLDEIQVQLISQGVPYQIKSDRDLVKTWAGALDLLDLSTALRKGEAVTDFWAAIANFKWFPRSVKRDALHHFRELGATEVMLSLQPHTQAHTLAKFEKALALLKQNRTVDGELGVIETQFMGYESASGSKAKKAPEVQVADESPFALLRKILEGKKSTRAQAIERLRGFITKAASANEISGPKVELSTYHSAKGRQWKTVFLPWVSGTSVPDPLTRPQFGELEAERRLFYVAMTRSSNTLVVGHPSLACKEWPSRFLYESGILQRQPQESGAPVANGRARPSAPGHVEAQFRANPAPTATTVRYTQVESIDAFLRTIGKRQGIKVAYGGSPELLFPLQLALLVEQVPYRIAPEHDVLYSSILRDVYKHVAKSRLALIRVVEQPEYPAYKTAYTSMVHWIESRKLEREAVKKVLDTAIGAAQAQRKPRAPIVVDFTRS